MARVGIHTQVQSPTSDPGNTHAWISVHEDNGKESHFGIYPSNQHNQEAFAEIGQERGYNGVGTDVREGVDAKKTPTASLYSEISNEDVQKLKADLEKPEVYNTRSNNCAQWASRTYEGVTGKELSTEHTFEKTSLSRGGTGECPHGLEKSIHSELAKSDSQKSNMEKPTTSSAAPASDWKAEFRQRNEESKIPPPPPPPPPDTQSQSKGRSR